MHRCSPHNGSQVRVRRSFDFIMSAIIANRLQKRSPFRHIGTHSLFIRPPGDVLIVYAVRLINVRSRRMHVTGKLRCAFCPMHERSEIVLGIGDVTTIYQGLGAISEGIFNRIRIEVLAAIWTVRHTSAEAVSAYWPGVFYPAAFIDLMNHPFNEQRRGNPEEKVWPTDLP